MHVQIRNFVQNPVLDAHRGQGLVLEEALGKAGLQTELDDLTFQAFCEVAGADKAQHFREVGPEPHA